MKQILFLLICLAASFTGRSQTLVVTNTSCETKVVAQVRIMFTDGTLCISPAPNPTQSVVVGGGPVIFNAGPAPIGFSFDGFQVEIQTSCGNVISNLGDAGFTTTCAVGLTSTGSTSGCSGGCTSINANYTSAGGTNWQLSVF